MCNNPLSSWMQICVFVTQSDLNIARTDLKRYTRYIIVHHVTKTIIKNNNEHTKSDHYLSHYICTDYILPYLFE